MNTLNYSEQIGVFQSFMDINPSHYIDFGGDLFYISDNGDVFSIEDKWNPESSIYIRVIVNDEFVSSKTFDNIEIYAGLGNDITIQAEFKTSIHKTDVISSLNSSDFTNRESTYYAAIPRHIDGVTRLRDKHIICNYRIYGSSDDRLFSIPYIKTKYRHSVI